MALLVDFLAVSTPAEKPHRQYATSGVYVKAGAGLKLRDKKVERLARRVRSVLAWIEPSDYPSVRAWSELEILCEQAYATLRTMGVVNSQNDSRRLVDDYRKLRATQILLTRELGMSPMSRRLIKADSDRAAFDIAQAASERIDGLVRNGSRATFDEPPSTDSVQPEKSAAGLTAGEAYSGPDGNVDGE